MKAFTYVIYLFYSRGPDCRCFLCSTIIYPCCQFGLEVLTTKRNFVVLNWLYCCSVGAETKVDDYTTTAWSYQHHYWVTSSVWPSLLSRPLLLCAESANLTDLSVLVWKCNTLVSQTTNPSPSLDGHLTSLVFRIMSSCAATLITYMHGCTESLLFSAFCFTAVLVSLLLNTASSCSRRQVSREDTTQPQIIALHVVINSPLIVAALALDRPLATTLNRCAK